MGISCETLQKTHYRGCGVKSYDIHWIFWESNPPPPKRVASPPSQPTESANVPTASYKISKFFAFYLKAITVDATNIYNI